MQLEKLWQFMQVDMEADRFENQIRQSEKRQKLLKQRNFLMDQQNNMKKLENDVAAMSAFRKCSQVFWKIWKRILRSLLKKRKP